MVVEAFFPETSALINKGKAKWMKNLPPVGDFLLPLHSKSKYR